jgi:hypothetical protein
MNTEREVGDSEDKRVGGGSSEVIACDITMSRKL